MVNLSQPGLVVFDMDSTLITIECIDELAALVDRKAEVAAITAAAMRGELDFAGSLRQRVAVLAGLERDQLAQLFQPIPLTLGAAELITWFRQKGWRTAVVSGGFTWFTEQLASAIGLDQHCANSLLWDADKLTGKVAEPIVDAQRKASQLKVWAEHYQIPLAQTIAVGDGANDQAMLEAAAVGVAFCAKPALQAVADIVINEPNLMALAHHLQHNEKQ
ncbi:phosphoserine phosphatase SerB [Pseudidiomarina salilacus]|uniref:phosphoserine phosphatase SerB n=1 Tax=Pseudidiomarina salilacus TaxID=3384452 RepID=UPI00398521DA